MKGIIGRLVAAALFGGFLSAQHLTLYTEVSPPWQFVDPAGKPAGYACEVVAELQRRVGNADPIQMVPWVRGYNELQGGPNIALFSMVHSEERDPLFQWVGPIAELHYAFFVKKGSRTLIRSLADARKLRLIGVYKEDARDQFLTAKGFTNLDRSLDSLVPLRKLLAGRIDAMVATRRGVSELCKMLGVKEGEVREALPFAQVQMYVAFSKATAEATVRAWAAALEGMRKDGTFERIFRRYFASDPLPGPPLRAVQASVHPSLP